MTTAKIILGIVPGLQATSLLALNLKNINMDLKPSKKIDISPKKIVKAGVGTLIGISLIKPTAQIISNL